MVNGITRFWEKHKEAVGWPFQSTPSTILSTFSAKWYQKGFLENDSSLQNVTLLLYSWHLNTGIFFKTLKETDLFSFDTYNFGPIECKLQNVQKKKSTNPCVRREGVAPVDYYQIPVPDFWGTMNKRPLKFKKKLK